MDYVFVAGVIGDVDAIFGFRHIYSFPNTLSISKLSINGDYSSSHCNYTMIFLIYPTEVNHHAHTGLKTSGISYSNLGLSYWLTNS
ncbi:hypothetical protein ES708_29956 [subsurface metagenome]